MTKVVPLHRRDNYLWLVVGLFGVSVILTQAVSAFRGESRKAEPVVSNLESKILVPYSEALSSHAYLEERLISELLVEAIIQIESSGNPESVGRAGERGLMQVKKDTWDLVTRRMFKRELPFERAFEPELNRLVGKTQLDILQEYLHLAKPFWQSDERKLLLGAYNAGFGAVQEAHYDVKRLPRSTLKYIDRVQQLHDYYLKQFNHAYKATETPVKEVQAEVEDDLLDPT